MPWWGWLLVGLALLVLLAAALAFLARRWIRRLAQGPAARRINALPLRAKLRLVRRLMVDPRVPLWAKTLLPALILYLAMPFDLIPDFIPVVGYFDDLLLVLAIAFLLRRAIPSSVLEENLEAVEDQTASMKTTEEGRGR
jgi:uncharacterized membrane protein YkvA (DUF1232 family)